MNKKLLSILLIALALLTSCRKDSTTSDRITMPISLDASMLVSDGDLKSIQFQFAESDQTNSDGTKRLLPKHLVKPNAEGKIPVHTMLASADGRYRGATTLMWKYDAETKTLSINPTMGEVLLSVEGEAAYVENTEWYLTAMIGGELKSAGSPGSYIIDIKPTRELSKAKAMTNPNNQADPANPAPIDLVVPFSIPWTRLEIKRTNVGADIKHVGSPKPNTGTATPGELPTIGSRKVVFKPLGAVIGYRLQNKPTGVSATDATPFTPKGFTIISNAFGDNGKYVFSGFNKTTETGKYLPWETEVCEEAVMGYTFAPGQEPGELSHGATSDYYYVWVKPTELEPSKVRTVALIEGDQAYANKTSLSRMWFGDYTPNRALTALMQKDHKAYNLTINMSDDPVKLPLEYVAEYNLSGNISIEGNRVGHTRGSWHPLHNGMEGRLRFSNRNRNTPANPYPALSEDDAHSKVSSGMYNWYVVKGFKDGITNTDGFGSEYSGEKYNPQGLSLIDQQAYDMDGTVVKLSTKYHIPRTDEWNAVFPMYVKIMRDAAIRWNGTSNSHLVQEFYRIGGEDNPRYLRFRTECKYTNAVKNGTKTTVYALRFLKPTDGKNGYDEWDIRQPQGKENVCYPAASDNRFASLYRFRIEEVGSMTSNDGGYTTSGYGLKFTIDVVHVGEAGAKLTLTDPRLSDENFWTTAGAKNANSEFTYVGQRRFAAHSYLMRDESISRGNGSGSTLGTEAYYWSSSAFRGDGFSDLGRAGYTDNMGLSAMFTKATVNPWVKLYYFYAVGVRPFYNE